MTTIIWKDKHLYVDSLIVKGSETFHSLTKVCKFQEPLEVDYVASDEVVKDTIYGFVATGNVRAAEGFMNTCYLTGVTNTCTIYKSAVGDGLAVPDNLFEIIAIGKEFLHSFFFEPAGFVSRVSENSLFCTAGAGGAAAHTQLTAGAHPIRAMYGTMHCMPRETGGMIDVWQLSTDEKTGKTSFDRVGICNELEGKRRMAVMMYPMQEYPYDLIPNPLRSVWTWEVTEKVQKAEAQIQTRQQVIHELVSALNHEQVDFVITEVARGDANMRKFLQEKLGEDYPTSTATPAAPAKKVPAKKVTTRATAKTAKKRPNLTI